jgi:septal ring factor EnvC (AmiA/AmiB activator)
VLLIVFGGFVFWLSFFFVGLFFFPVWVALFLVLLKKTKHRVSELREYKIQMDEDLKQSQGVVKNAQGKQMQVEQQCTALRQEVSKLNKCIQEEKNKVEESRLYIGQCKQQHGSDIEQMSKLKSQMETMKHAQATNVQTKGQLESKFDLYKTKANQEKVQLKAKHDHDVKELKNQFQEMKSQFQMLIDDKSKKMKEKEEQLERQFERRYLKETGEQKEQFGKQMKRMQLAHQKTMKDARAQAEYAIGKVVNDCKQAKATIEIGRAHV